MSFSNLNAEKVSFVSSCDHAQVMRKVLSGKPDSPAGKFRRPHMTAIHLQPCDDCLDRRPQRAALAALSDAADWAFATLREWRRRSRERAQLAALDDRMLRDIGLTHADREFLANKPFWRE
jgi:uncharacterized protein YjiS (DUF1127 family)